MRGREASTECLEKSRLYNEINESIPVSTLRMSRSARVPICVALLGAHPDARFRSWEVPPITAAMTGKAASSRFQNSSGNYPHARLCRVMTPCVSSTSCHTCYHILPTFAGALQTLAIQCVQNSDPSSLRAKTSSRLTPFTQRATAEGDREGS